MGDVENNKLVITDRRELCINGVDRVLGFDDNYVLLDSKEGRITIEGGGLAIESLDKESGELIIKGKISAVIYSDAKAERKSIFERIFK